MEPTSRRRALQIIGASGALAPSALAFRQRLAMAGGHVLTTAENAILDAATERIIPADEHSGGARAALVAPFLDHLLAARIDKTKQRWRAGLQAFDKESRRQTGKAFTSLNPQAQDAVLASLAKAEAAPASEGELFFVELKAATIEAYYTTDIGIHQELGYVGNVARDHFDGCTHPEHWGKK
ncbi:MAG: gluconate 2-dehydrogenase subunit 3 family protein [Deltaproteobacteria bacterium]|nr:gluconate 2-dehydrogenase subunit 3 family protein [Deltaproteobacteria bacterium]